MVLSERTLKTKLETSVKWVTPFYWESILEKQTVIAELINKI